MTSIAYYFIVNGINAALRSLRQVCTPLAVIQLVLHLTAINRTCIDECLCRTIINESVNSRRNGCDSGSDWWFLHQTDGHTTDFFVIVIIKISIIKTHSVGPPLIICCRRPIISFSIKRDTSGKTRTCRRQEHTSLPFQSSPIDRI